MPTYNVKAINVGSFDLGEADRVLTVFSRERGLLKAVAKAARKPGSKMSGRAEALCVNELLLAKGRSFEIISQAQTVESFSFLRTDLQRLSMGLYYAELTACFGKGLELESQEYFDFLLKSLFLLKDKNSEPLALCMQFEFALLDFLGYKPDLTFCISCREVLQEYNLSRFLIENGGIVCLECFKISKRHFVREANDEEGPVPEFGRAPYITPLVWKTLVLRQCNDISPANEKLSETMQKVQSQSQRLLQAYIEEKAGKKFKSLDLLEELAKLPG